MVHKSYLKVWASSQDFDTTVARVKACLLENGFGVMSEIDVSAALKKKLDVDFARTLILGACNPVLALDALQSEADVAVFMPCNVVVREVSGGGVEVAAVQSSHHARSVGQAAFTAVAQQADMRIQRAISAATAN
ncbi:MAG: DUF302 domain-containing protein [Magnetococcus sp. WYHC-3]